MFYGPGARWRRRPVLTTLGDLVTVARNQPAPSARGIVVRRPARAPMGQTRTRYHISLGIDDRPGVLAAVAAVFAARGVSIETVRQRMHGPDDAELVIVTHHSTDEALAATVAGLRGLAAVRDVLSMMQVEETGRGPPLARCHRGVPHPAAGERRHPW